MDETIRFTRGVPPVESFPGEQLLECMGEVIARYGDEVQQYRPSNGFGPLREWIAREIICSPGQILLGQGSLQLLDIAARQMINPGDLAYVESPTYDRTITVLRHAGADVRGFRLEADGPDPDAIESAIKADKAPKFMYLIPDFQNPSGKVMSLEKRRAIVELADRYDFYIFEDSPYRILRYRGEDVASMYSLNPERVCLMSSYSKTICPGLRVGYMVLPDSLYPSVARMAEDTYINSSYINQAIVYEYLRKGMFEAHLEQIRNLYVHKLDAMLLELDRQFSGLGRWSKPEGGFFIGLELDQPFDMDVLIDRAVSAGLIISDSRGFFPDRDCAGFIRLPFCGLNGREIEVGLGILAKVVQTLNG